MLYRFRFRRALLLFGALVLTASLAFDLAGPQRSDLRRFDADAVARLETDLWRAYYKRERVRLYVLMGRLLRTQEGFPFLRAHVAAFHAARAAFLFKQGRTRDEYQAALPSLTRYYAMICRLGGLTADPARLATLELEWWIVHRHHGRDRAGAARALAVDDPVLATAVADTAAALYDVSREAALPYGRERARAMRLRDAMALRGSATEDDWAAIAGDLQSAYRSLRRAVTP